MRTILTTGIKPSPQIFFKPDGDDTGGGDDKPLKAKNLAEFQSRFAASRVAPLMVGQAPVVEKKPDEKVADDKVKDEHADDEPDDDGDEDKSLVNESPQDRNKRESDERKNKRPGSNIHKILEDKRKAESERDELKKKVTEFEETKKTNDAKIVELQGKIESGEFSSKKEAEFKGKIEKLEADTAAEREGLVKENERLRTRVSYYDLSEDKTFNDKYVQPVVEAYTAAASAIGNDEKLMELLDRAVSANAHALGAQKKEARLAAERDRDALLTQIEEALPGFTGKRFSAAVGAYIDKTQTHAEALSKHEETAKTMREQARTENTTRYAKTLETWNNLYTASDTKFLEDAALSKEDAERAKEMGLKWEDELKESSTLGKKVVNGQATPSESIEMVHRGRVYPVLKAQIAVLQARLTAAEKVIDKQRKGGTGGGSDTRDKVKDEPKNGVIGADGKKMTRSEWHKKFGASRPGLREAPAEA